MFRSSFIKYFLFTASGEALLVVGPIVLLQKYTNAIGLGNSTEVKGKDSKENVEQAGPHIEEVVVPTTIEGRRINLDMQVEALNTSTGVEVLEDMSDKEEVEQTQEEESKEVVEAKEKDEEEALPDIAEEVVVDEQTTTSDISTQIDAVTSVGVVNSVGDQAKQISKQEGQEEAQTSPTKNTEELGLTATSQEVDGVVNLDGEVSDRTFTTTEGLVDIVTPTTTNETTTQLATSSAASSIGVSGLPEGEQVDSDNTHPDSGNTLTVPVTKEEITSGPENNSSSTNKKTKKPKKKKKPSKKGAEQGGGILEGLNGLFNLNGSESNVDDDLEVEEEEDLEDELDLSAEIVPEEEEEIDLEEVEAEEHQAPTWWTPVTIPKNNHKNWPSIGGPTVTTKNYIYGYTANSSHKFTSLEIKQVPSKNYGCVYRNYYDAFCVAEKISWTKTEGEQQIIKVSDLDAKASLEGLNLSDFSNTYQMYRIEVLAGLYDNIDWEKTDSLYLFGTNREIFGRFVLAFGKKGNQYHYKTKYFKGKPQVKKEGLQITKEDKCSIGTKAHKECKYYKLETTSENKQKLPGFTPATELTKNEEYLISYMPVKFDVVENSQSRMLYRPNGTKPNIRINDFIPVFAIKDKNDLEKKINKQYANDLPIVLLKD